MKRFPMQPYPTSWYRVAQSTDVQRGKLTTAHYFGRDLVLYRGTDGKPRVFDAYCPHLGAHLAHGGQVDGNDVICPFHRWRFDGEGMCSDIPYTDRIPTRARLTGYPVDEVNGVVIVYWDEDGGEPTWSVPAIEAYDDIEAWTERHWRTWRLRTHVQEIFENGPDVVHQATVHCALDYPESTSDADGVFFYGKWWGKYEAGEGLPIAEVDQVTHQTHVGLGFTHLRIDLDYAGLQIEREIQFCLTPIDEDHIDATLSTRGRRIGDVEIDKAIDEAITFHTWRSFDEDVPIWDNKIYRSLPAQHHEDRPVASAVFVDADRDIAKLRAWARQFYRENSGV